MPPGAYENTPPTARGAHQTLICLCKKCFLFFQKMFFIFIFSENVFYLIYNSDLIGEDHNSTTYACFCVHRRVFVQYNYPPCQPLNMGHIYSDTKMCIVIAAIQIVCIFSSIQRHGKCTSFFILLFFLAQRRSNQMKRSPQARRFYVFS
jgi:hypothetical protein